MAEEIKRILLVADHNVFREALAMRLEQEEDLKVAWQAGSITDTRDVHLNGVDHSYVDPFLPDGDGLELIREVSVANPNAPSTGFGASLELLNRASSKYR